MERYSSAHERRGVLICPITPTPSTRLCSVLPFTSVAIPFASTCCPLGSGIVAMNKAPPELPDVVGRVDCNDRRFFGINRDSLFQRNINAPTSQWSQLYPVPGLLFGRDCEKPLLDNGSFHSIQDSKNLRTREIEGEQCTAAGQLTSRAYTSYFITHS